MQTSDMGRVSLPVTEALAQRFLSLPIYAELRPEQVEEVVRKLRKASPVKSTQSDIQAMLTS